MVQALHWLDWLVIGIYLVGLIAWAVYLSKGQEDRADYYLGGRKLGAWPVAISIMATQCSTNSILGAPAFVAFSAAGGLLWLQYELALPLAMILLMLVVMPVFRHFRLVSVYQFLEQRYNLSTRLLLSGLFLFIRAFATAVTVYSIAIVIDLITGIGFFWSVLLLGAFTVLYDVFGGMRGVVYSDILQMAILVAVLALLFWLLTSNAGGLAAMWQQLPAERQTSLDFRHHGLGDGYTFAFWPMLIGGFFLYLAYYGCDQSQVQRELSTRDIDATNQALLLNGLLRFPLVLLYCLVGVGIAVYAANHPGFLTALPGAAEGSPQYNLAVPLYMVNSLPPGVVGLGLVALFAAAMSSLDSVLNSLSATTMEDFIVRFRAEPFSDHQEIWASRGVTTLWGVITLSMAFFVGDIAPTVLEAINKIGSLANGSILAVFIVGLFSHRITGWGVCLGLIAGIVVNALCWQFLPALSWLWWNPLGFAVTALVASSSLLVPSDSTKIVHLATAARVLREQARYNWWWLSLLLVLWFVVLLLFLLWL
ncbi:sodium:solute symporter [Halioxenophilus sp. WMMB6]|uniref:sodium:solute symporter n=1 Tax=Halioxenophilus sp. WMMB6 TaxID=3073815 RepID=UPI00295F06D9|nr:sodium:solute symporter [Halioxenophilus sp. WMMB6]